MSGCVCSGVKRSSQVSMTSNPITDMASQSESYFNPDSDLFNELNSIKGSLATKNQPIIPAMIKLFGEFRTHLLEEFRAQLLQDLSNSIKSARAGQELGPKGPSSWIEFLFEELLELGSSFLNQDRVPGNEFLFSAFSKFLVPSSF